MTIDYCLKNLEQLGSSILAGNASLVASFASLACVTGEYFLQCRNGAPRDAQMERDLGGGWIGVGSLSPAHATFREACHAFGLRLCRAPMRDAFHALEDEVSHALLSHMPHLDFYDCTPIESTEQAQQVSA